MMSHWTQTKNENSKLPCMKMHFEMSSAEYGHFDKATMCNSVYHLVNSNKIVIHQVMISFLFPWIWSLTGVKNGFSASNKMVLLNQISVIARASRSCHQRRRYITVSLLSEVRYELHHQSWNQPPHWSPIVLHFFFLDFYSYQHLHYVLGMYLIQCYSESILDIKSQLPTYFNWVNNGSNEAETRWPPFRRRHFQMHILEWKCMNYDWKITEVCS